MYSTGILPAIRWVLLASDLLRIPNLMQRSYQALRASIGQILSWGEAVVLPPAQAALALFGLCRCLSMAIVASICLLIVTTFSAWGFETAGPVAGVLSGCDPAGRSYWGDPGRGLCRSHSLQKIAVKPTCGVDRCCCAHAVMLLPMSRSVVVSGSVSVPRKAGLHNLDGTLLRFAPIRVSA